MAVNQTTPVLTDPKGREMIEHGTALFPVACYHDDLREIPVAWHWHEELEVLIVEEGIARVGVSGQDFLVRKGEGFFINAGVLHGVWMENAPGACRLRSIVFHPRFVAGSRDSVLWQKYVEPLIGDPSRPYAHFSGGLPWEQEAVENVARAWLACAREAEGFEFAVRQQLSQIMLLLLKHSRAAEKPSLRKLRGEERTKQMLQFIQSHLADGLTLGQIAESASVSENECMRCFRSVLGISPMQYVKQTRVRRAAELLAQTDRKIADIGSECGFQEMSYFAKAFRAQMGCTPSQYRLRAAANHGGAIGP